MSTYLLFSPQTNLKIFELTELKLDSEIRETHYYPEKSKNDRPSTYLLINKCVISQYKDKFKGINKNSDDRISINIAKTTSNTENAIKIKRGYIKY
ncbi:hypothetical protein TTHERM_000963250 (macronuclear) [Tetrahymena thermophila SB210]|uniref:Uncharacterized protein n=1 Tax=Tetrahymena thermophila (strain SB210) TaxID=312017 RepID=W7XGK5_TETTS|nr:hypothetical protein TTHERM_000963250 [Tetrahymena thermophila SB210]EWS76148.1 hypothetical protein TTHERM_000963250 [Tetrahymena thermophila SB210]|eukprot:XP_012651301.1 hypothetical protein TTHERM_000963250 [Tetrahymena thermophila SB210]